jgi:hypothetical protein
MPKVPQYNSQPVQSIYNPTNPNDKASVKQKSLLLTLCERRKIQPPELSTLTMGQASQIISDMLDSGHDDRKTESLRRYTDS